MEMLIPALFLGLIPGFIARSKRRSFFSWYVYGVLLFIVALIHSIVIKFNLLIGNNILLTNPYGSLYKIHGCITEPIKTIITEEDYEQFEEKYELIRAQLLSLFIHNPIILAMKI
ncbi:MAG: hypothetical protein H6Q69_3161 [Firmicutes bacterium]|nr:hypothetical protein [Bacillota bacterium]